MEAITLTPPGYKVHFQLESLIQTIEYETNEFCRIAGYQKLKEFIVTQHPLESTISDFWQMVWDHNSQTVIVLSETNEDDYQIFWPLKQADVEFENFRVRFIDEHQIALPAVNSGASVPSDEFITQIEVAAQSLQVFTNQTTWSRFHATHWRRLNGETIYIEYTQ